MLLAGIGAPVERQRRVLVDVLELRFVQPTTLRKTAGDAQLHLLPFAKELADALRPKRTPTPGLRHNCDPFPR